MLLLSDEVTFAAVIVVAAFDVDVVAVVAVAVVAVVAVVDVAATVCC